LGAGGPKNTHGLPVTSPSGSWWVSSGWWVLKSGGNQKEVATLKTSTCACFGVGWWQLVGIEGWWRLERSGNPENEQLCSLQGWVVVAGG